MKCEKTGINFKGYKNIIADNFKNNANVCKIRYLSLQLDNEGHKDLEIWHNIQKKYLNITDLNDVLLFLEMQFGRNHYLFVNNELIPATKDDLEKLSNKGIFNLYTLLASLTKRISNNNALKLDNDFNKVMLSTLYLFSAKLHDSTSAYDLVNSAIIRQKSPQKIAGTMNNSIDDVMRNYFV